MRLIRDGEKGGGALWRWRKREIIYLSLHCHYQNDSCIKMGSDESPFYVSLTVREKSQDSVPRQQFLKRKESRSGFEPRSLCSSYQPNALPLGQTGFHTTVVLRKSWTALSGPTQDRHQR